MTTEWRRGLWAAGITLAAAAIVVAGAWFLAMGWSATRGGGRVLVAGAALVGMAAAALTPLLARRDRHRAAALTATVAALTPTGFAYPLNVVMLGVAGGELARRRRAR